MSHIFADLNEHNYRLNQSADKHTIIEPEFFIQTYLIRVTELVIYVNDLTQSV